jgi:hypothetical protein
MQTTLKTLHLLGVCLFMGNIIVSGFWKAMADRVDELAVARFATRLVNLTDAVFTGTGATLLLVAGHSKALRRTRGSGGVTQPLGCRASCGLRCWCQCKFAKRASCAVQSAPSPQITNVWRASGPSPASPPHSSHCHRCTGWWRVPFDKTQPIYLDTTPCPSIHSSPYTPPQP